MGQQQLLLIILGVIIVGIAVAVGITMFKTNSVNANRDAVINDLTNLAARAQQFYRRPVSLGGGGGDFSKFVLTKREESNPNGAYSAAPTATNVVLTGKGTEIGDDQTNLVEVQMTVWADSFKVTKVVN